MAKVTPAWLSEGFTSALTGVNAAVAPDLGQHNAEIAAELGLTASEIESLQADGVLFTA